MQKHQLDMWLHGEHKDSYQTPKVYVIGCSDISEYLLAVEYKPVSYTHLTLPTT